MAFHLLILIIFISTPTLVVSGSASYNFTIAKPNCNHTCGDINIPFPFGTTQDCSRSDGYWGMTCNYTTDPPKLLWGNSTIQVTHISLDGQFKLLQSIARDCYARNGSRTSYFSPWTSLATHFTLNNTANKFTIVGCDAYGFVSGWRLDRNYTTGCTALCESEDDLVEDKCEGVGCCQSSIPENVWKVDVEVRSYWNHSRVLEFNNCSYAFFAEVGAFNNFSKNNLNNLYNGGYLPMVVDWAIGNGTCQEAEANVTAYACVSPNSGCFKPDNGYGYRCLCKDGFQGNPYLSDGCQDVDECASGANDCVKEAPCKNTVGNYTCSCPKGYSGSGRVTDQGCKDIDECLDSGLNDCMASANCNNTVGSFSCSCPKGYSGNGRRPNGCQKQQDLKIVFILIVSGKINF